MTEDSCPRPASSDEASAARQRKKRKWDQPAESLVSAGVALPGVLPFSGVGSLVGIPLVGIASPSGALLTTVTIPPVFQTSSIQQHASATVQKLNQLLPKIQDELIAREIIINDAESTVRYKLTKRQMQEEIQKCTGAVVITRGKYRPPNAPPDGEKPLYLHISAGSHLKDTAERIKAVDLAAAMVEEMLKHGQNIQPVPSNSHLAGNAGAPSTCVFLGFEADPSLNIAARIRGPNDQYINHIMNETGATVSLRGRGSGNSESPHGEGQLPLHLFLSSNNLKGLDDAKLLAENLLDTIGAEYGASRASSSKVYGAVPPPLQFSGGVQSSGNELNAKASSAACLTSSAVSSTPSPLVSPPTVPGVATVFSQGAVSQCGGLLNPGQPQSNLVCCPPPALTGGTSYSGYGGIYPQATPLQQVALALRQSSSPLTSSVAPSSTTSLVTNSSAASFTEKEKRHPQRRKFQESPVALKGPTKPQQGLQFQSETSAGLTVRNTSTMPAPMKLVQSSSNGMPPPPPKGPMGPPTPPPPKFSSPTRTMPPPPPPPKFSSPVTVPKADDQKVLNKSKSDTVPDTLSKLMEYGEEDEDPDEAGEDSWRSNSGMAVAPKPFWAV